MSNLIKIAHTERKGQYPVTMYKDINEKVYKIVYGHDIRYVYILDDAVRIFANRVLHQLECAGDEDIMAV